MRIDLSVVKSDGSSNVNSNSTLLTTLHLLNLISSRHGVTLYRRNRRDPFTALGELAVQLQFLFGGELMNIQSHFVPKETRNLLETQQLGLREELPHQPGTEHGQNDKHNVELPSDLGKSHGGSLRIDQCRREEAGHTEPGALGAQRRREDLTAIYVARGVHAATIEKNKQKEEEDSKAVADSVGRAAECGHHGCEADQRTSATGLDKRQQLSHTVGDVLYVQDR